MELKDVKEFFSSNADTPEVKDYIKGLATDERMLAEALNTEKGEAFFQKTFDRKISESKKKMDENYQIKLESALKAKETEWIEKHKKVEQKSPLEIKMEEQTRKMEQLEAELRRKDIMSKVKLPDPLKPFANDLIKPDWTDADIEAFSEKATTTFEEHIAKAVEDRLNGHTTHPKDGKLKPQLKTKYSEMSAKELASLPDGEYEKAMDSIMSKNNNNGD